MKIRVIACIGLLLSALIWSCQDDKAIAFRQYYTSGSMVYQEHCQNCHSAKGEGLAGLIPPLNDTASLKRYKDTLACILKNGLKGKINIAGREYNGIMPATGLAPMEMAQVITYITNTFGNKQGLTNSDMVEDELGKCK